MNVYKEISIIAIIENPKTATKPQKYGIYVY